MSTDLIQKAIAEDDAASLAKHATAEELAKLKAAEELLALNRERSRRTGRIQLVTSMLVGIVAVAGMLVNSYQSFSARQTAQEQSRVDQDR